MSLRVICPECKRALNIKENLSGRTIKCPGCEAKIAVPAAGDGKPVAGRESASLEAKPPAPTKGESLGSGNQKKKRKKGGSKKGIARTLYLAIGGVLIALLLCAAGSVGAWFFVFASPDPERTFIGRWTPEGGEGIPAGSISALSRLEAVEISEGKWMIDLIDPKKPMIPVQNSSWGTWNLIERDKAALTIEYVNETKKTGKIQVRVIDKNRLAVKSVINSKDFAQVWKRVR